MNIGNEQTLARLWPVAYCDSSKGFKQLGLNLSCGVGNRIDRLCGLCNQLLVGYLA